MLTVQSRNKTDNASVSTFDSVTFLDFRFWIDSFDFDASSSFMLLLFYDVLFSCDIVVIVDNYYDR